MGVTISHRSALEVTRALRSEGVDVRVGIDHTALHRPSPWEGMRWGMKEFYSDDWHHDAPSKGSPLDILVPDAASRIRMSTVESHVCGVDLPGDAILWLDATSSMVSPAMLFVQMAEVMSLPSLVLLGHELCGFFSCSARSPIRGPVSMNVKPAVTLEELNAFLCSLAVAEDVPRGRTVFVRGLTAARRAVHYVSEGAVSVPEAVLSTMYSLPPEEGGYGMGPVTLNAKRNIAPNIRSGTSASRYPDILFSFANIGINYEGPDHLDLESLVQEAVSFGRALESGVDVTDARLRLKGMREALYEKYQDDIWRDRELLASGSVVVRAAKRDLYMQGGLDKLTAQLLSYARTGLGINTDSYDRVLEDTELKRLRNEVLHSLLYGKDDHTK